MDAVAGKPGTRISSWVSHVVLREPSIETTFCCLPTEHWQQAGSKMEQPELGVELNGMLVTEAAVFTH